MPASVAVMCKGRLLPTAAVASAERLNVAAPGAVKTSEYTLAFFVPLLEKIPAGAAKDTVTGYTPPAIVTESGCAAAPGVSVGIFDGVMLISFPTDMLSAPVTFFVVPAAVALAVIVLEPAAAGVPAISPPLMFVVL